MNDGLKSILNNMKDFIEKHPGLKEYARKNGATSARRFWLLLRADVMRLAPNAIATYLKRTDLKIVEATRGNQSFGPDLASRYFAETMDQDTLRFNQEALIYACLEMDAAWKVLNMRDAGRAHNQKAKLDELERKLKLWSVK